MVNLPAVFTSFAAVAAKLLISFVHTDFFNSCFVASSVVSTPFVMTLLALVVDFLGSTIWNAGLWCGVYTNAG